MEQYRQALKINPSYAKAHNNLGCALRGKGQADEAMAEFEQALKIAPDYADAQNNYGVMLARQGRYEEAIGHFAAALKIDPYCKGAIDNLCRAGIDSNKPDDVLETLLSLQQKAPSYAELYYRAAVIYDAKGQPEKAVEQLEKALSYADSRADAELVRQIKEQLQRLHSPPAEQRGP
jgi:Tfp pilus assembly protein PilF